MTNGNRYHENRSPAGIIGHSDLATMQFYKALHKVQPYATATVRRLTLLVNLIKAVEDVSLILVADSHTRIADFYFEHVRLGHLRLQNPQRHVNTPAVVRELKRIRQEIIHYLAYLVVVKTHHQRLNR